ncbi:hypothetical protein [Algibacillus agarilyticus]|uniref:hypothetical protein n=1 Tax=Algibacillus agarilyticus TaxID=2234133 RepID=UPI000DCFD894|nr:hypothetical protein [Algibacillus agarilyticus]
MKTLITICLLFVANIAFATGWNYNNNRIAISADGNNQPDKLHFWPRADPDDWGATPATLAIIAKLKRQHNLVHFSYNNFIDSAAHTTAINEMAVGIQGAIKHWHYDNANFFDVTTHYKHALNHLVKVIEVSTKDDPLYFVHMGPAEFFYRAVKQVIAHGKIDSLAHVYVLSHSGYNDNHLRRGDSQYDKNPVPDSEKHHTLPQAIKLSGDRIQYRRIKDQNGQWDPNLLWNSKQDWSVWQWMKNHSDESVSWMYQRMQRHPDQVADISDAGMVYFLLLGDENGSPEKFKHFIGQGIN